MGQETAPSHPLNYVRSPRQFTSRCHNYSRAENSSVRYIKVHMETRWTIRHSLMLLWFTDLMNVTEEVTIHRPRVKCLFQKPEIMTFPLLHCRLFFLQNIALLLSANLPYAVIIINFLRTSRISSIHYQEWQGFSYTWKKRRLWLDCHKTDMMR